VSPERDRFYWPPIERGAAPTVLGIDPSLAGCAIALSTTEYPVQLERWSSKPCGPTPHERCERYRNLAAPIIELGARWKPTIVVIEGYAFAAHGGAGHSIIEFGGILRNGLVYFTPRIVEVPPSQLKLFAAGSGRADKNDVVLALSQRYRVTFESHDEADAFACMAIGRCLLGLSEPLDAFENEVVCKLLGRPWPKRPKAKKQKELAL
jgi:crossover junction endodeoxyribonuclease RuvC